MKVREFNFKENQEYYFIIASKGYRYDITVLPFNLGNFKKYAVEAIPLSSHGSGYACTMNEQEFIKTFGNFVIEQ